MTRTPPTGHHLLLRWEMPVCHHIQLQHQQPRTLLQVLPRERTADPHRDPLLLPQRHRGGLQLPGAGGLLLPVELEKGVCKQKTKMNE